MIDWKRAARHYRGCANAYQLAFGRVFDALDAAGVALTTPRPDGRSFAFHLPHDRVAMLADERDALRAVLATLPRCEYGTDASRGALPPFCGALASHRVDGQWYVCATHHARMLARWRGGGSFDALPWYDAATKAGAT